MYNFSMNKLYENKIKSEEIYKGRVFTVTHDEVELSDGYKTFRDVVHHNGGVVIVAEKESNILMVEQYRYATSGALLELPAGKLDKGNEDILSAAKRELEEETGFNAKNWESLGYIWTSPGFCSEKLYLFKASDLSYKGQHLDVGEILNYIQIPREKVFKMVKNGEISDAKTICALMRAYKL